MNRNWTWKTMALLLVGIAALAGCTAPEDETVGNDDLTTEPEPDIGPVEQPNPPPEPDAGPFEEPEPDIGPDESPGPG